MSFVIQILSKRAQWLFLKLGRIWQVHAALSCVKEMAKLLFFSSFWIIPILKLYLSSVTSSVICPDKGFRLSWNHLSSKIISFDKTKIALRKSRVFLLLNRRPFWTNSCWLIGPRINRKFSSITFAIDDWNCFRKQQKEQREKWATKKAAVSIGAMVMTSTRTWDRFTFHARQLKIEVYFQLGYKGHLVINKRPMKSSCCRLNGWNEKKEKGVAAVDGTTSRDRMIMAGKITSRASAVRVETKEKWKLLTVTSLTIPHQWIPSSTFLL